MIFGDYFAYITNLTQGYVTSNTVIVANAIAPAVTALLSLYVILWGISSLRGLIQEPITEAAARFVKIALICSLALQLGHYNELIVDTFVNGPEDLARMLAGATNPNSTVSSLDVILETGFAAGKNFWQKGGLFSGDVGMYLIALSVWAVTLAITIFSFVLIILSKVMLSILLALGPIFIVSLLFQASAGYFTGWINQMANYSLLTILVIATNKLVITMFQQAAVNAFAATEVAQILPMIVTGVIAFMTLAQLTSVAAGLAGGFALSSQGAGILGLSVLSRAARKTGALAKYGIKKIPRHEKNRQAPRDTGPSPASYGNRSNHIGPA